MKQESYLLLYFGVEQGKNIGEDPRYKYLANPENFTEFLSNITQVAFTQIFHYRGTLEIKDSQKPIYFALADTQAEAKTELKKSIPDAFDDRRASLSCYNSIQFDLEKDGVLVNFQKDNPSSLLKCATAIIYKDERTTLEINNAKAVSFDEFKQQIIQQIKQADFKPTAGFFAAMGKTLSRLACCGTQNNNSEESVNLVFLENTREELLQTKLFDKIENAESLPRLFDFLSSYVPGHQEDEPVITSAITDLLNKQGFDAIRPSQDRLSVTYNHN